MTNVQAQQPAYRREEKKYVLRAPPTKSGPSSPRRAFHRNFDFSWSLLNHGVAERMRLNLGNLNPIYERELIKLGVYQKVEGS